MISWRSKNSGFWTMRKLSTVEATQSVVAVILFPSPPHTQGGHDLGWITEKHPSKLGLVPQTAAAVTAQNPIWKQE
jgi:hypothetical protein